MAREARVYQLLNLKNRFVFEDIPLSARSVVEGTTFYLQVGDYIDGAISSYDINVPTATFLHFTNAYIDVGGDDRFQIGADALLPSDPNSFSGEVTIRVENAQGQMAETTFNLVNYKKPRWDTIDLADRRGVEGSTFVIELSDHILDITSGITYSLIGDDNPDYASISGSELTLVLPAVTENTDIPIQVRARRNISHIDVQEDTTITVRNLNNLGANWSLVRGLTQTYDIPDMIGGDSDTGWSLPDSPADLSISDSGVITADLPFDRDDIGIININTDQTSYQVPTTIRDFFPTDASENPIRFYSSWRSWNGDAREVWRGRYVSPLSPSSFDDVEIIVMSRDDGYVYLDDITALLPALTGVHAIGFIEITRITDQNGNFHLDLDESAGDPMFVCHVNNGTPVYREHNNHPYFRATWSPVNINSIYGISNRNDIVYRSQDTSTSMGISHAQIGVQRRRGTAYKDFKTGDGNSFPGTRFVSSSQSNNLFQPNFNNSKPGTLQLTQTQIASFFAAQIETLRNTTLLNAHRRQGRVYGIENNSGIIGTAIINNNGGHDGTGMELDADEWDFAELAIFEPDNTFAAAETFRNTDRIRLINNLVANFGEQGHRYT